MPDNDSFVEAVCSLECKYSSISSDSEESMSLPVPS